MKNLRFLFVLLTVLGFQLRLAAAPEAPPTGDAAAELQAVVAKVQAKLKAGATTAAALAPEIAEFDALLAKHQGEKTEAVSRILVMKAMLYVQVFEDNVKGVTLLKQVKADFPDSEAGKNVDRIIESVEERAKAASLQAGLVGKPAPALSFSWASRKGLSSLEDLKGKVVVLDFWATWCGPCIASFPNVAEVVSTYQGYDVEVVGVTSLQGRIVNLEAQPIDCKGNPAKETGLLPAFMKAKNMTWTVAVSTEPVFNPDYAIEGIPYMVIIAPDGTVRHTGLHPAMPHADKVEKINAILKEFKLRVPPPAKA